MNEEEKEVIIFAVNRSKSEEILLDVTLERFDDIKLIEHVVLAHMDPDAINSPEQPDNVVPHADGMTTVDENEIHVHLRQYSWNMIRLSGEYSLSNKL